MARGAFETADLLNLLGSASLLFEVGVLQCACFRNHQTAGLLNFLRSGSRSRRGFSNRNLNGRRTAGPAARSFRPEQFLVVILQSGRATLTGLRTLVSQHANAGRTCCVRLFCRQLTGSFVLSEPDTRRQSDGQA